MDFMGAKKISDSNLWKCNDERDIFSKRILQPAVYYILLKFLTPPRLLESHCYSGP